MPTPQDTLWNMARDPAGFALRNNPGMAAINQINDYLSLHTPSHVKVGEPKPVERGYLVKAGSRFNEGIEFQNNPEEITREKEPRYRTIHSPGLSHTLYQYIDGGRDEIDFELKLNANVDSFCKWKPRIMPPAQQLGIANYTLLELQIGWLRAQTVALANRNGVLSAPPKLLLVLGAWFTEVRLLKVKDVKKNFDPGMTFKEAIVTVQLGRVIDRHQNPEDLMREY